jgi:hypothetical protein
VAVRRARGRAAGVGHARLERYECKHVMSGPRGRRPGDTTTRNSKQQAAQRAPLVNTRATARAQAPPPPRPCARTHTHAHLQPFAAFSLGAGFCQPKAARRPGQFTPRAQRAQRVRFNKAEQKQAQEHGEQSRSRSRSRAYNAQTGTLTENDAQTALWRCTAAAAATSPPRPWCRQVRFNNKAEAEAGAAQEHGDQSRAAQSRAYTRDSHGK